MQLFGFITDPLHHRHYVMYQVTHMRQSNGLRSERCDASHFIFHFKMKIMNGG